MADNVSNCYRSTSDKHKKLKISWKSLTNHFIVRRYALRGLSYRNSVRLSVRPSVTLVDCVHMV